MTQLKIKLLKSEEKSGKMVHTAVLTDGTEGYYDAKKYPSLEKGMAVGYTSTKTPKGAIILEFTFPDKDKTGTIHPKISDEHIFDKKCEGAFVAMQVTFEKLFTDKMDFDKINEWYQVVSQTLADTIDGYSKE